MNELISAARGVLENWEKGDLAAAVRALQGALEALPEKVTATPEQVAVAKDYTGWSDELRFDADAEIPFTARTALASAPQRPVNPPPNP